MKTTLVNSSLTPDIPTWVSDGGLIAGNNPFISEDGSQVFVSFLASPQLSAAQAQLYSNKKGNLSLLSSLIPDGSEYETATAGASEDFSLFNVVDDDGVSNIRIRVYQNSGSNTFSSALYTGYLTDLAIPDLEDDAYFTPDNKFLFITYPSTSGFILRVMKVSPGLPVIASITTTGFGFGPKPVQIGNIVYLVLNYETFTGTIIDPILGPPFGFQIYSFDLSSCSLELVITSPPMYDIPVIDITTVCRKNKTKLRIAAGLSNFNLLDPSLPSPIVQVPETIPAYSNSDNIQVFDFNPCNSKLKQVFSTSVEGGTMGFVVWLPNSNGKTLGISPTLTASLDPYNPIGEIAGGTFIFYWLHLDKCTTSYPVFYGSLPSYAQFYGISKNNKYLAIGAFTLTQTAYEIDPSLGFPTVGPSGEFGYNNLLVYKLTDRLIS